MRTYVRGLAEGVSGFSWFTLTDTGWRYTGLVQQRTQLKPAFRAYKELIFLLQRDNYKFNLAYLGPAPRIPVFQPD